MKKVQIFTFLVISVSSILLAACGSDSITETQEKTPAETQKTLRYTAKNAAGVIAEIRSSDSIKVGYQTLDICLKDAQNKALTEKSVQIKPLMDMGMMMGKAMIHSAPIEQPTQVTDTQGCTNASVVWLMEGKWTFSVILAADTVKFDSVSVIADTTRLKKAEDAQDTAKKIFVALISKTPFKSGINDFEVAVYTKKDMMTWPADSSYSIVADPTMPSMGHGSPYNVNPVHVKNGHFKGSLNFTMTGDWLISLTLTNAQGKESLKTGFWTKL
jgi:hypothetical protein